MIRILFAFLVVLSITTAAFAVDDFGRITKYYQDFNGNMVISYGKAQKTVTLRDTDPDTDAIRKEAALGHLVMERATGNEKIALSDDGQVLGWLVDFGGCTVSTSCPELLIVYRNGKIAGRINAKYIWDWRFVNNGAQVAYRMSATRDEGPQHYVLYDVKAGSEAAKVNGDTPSDAMPAWTQGLIQ